MKAMKSDFTLRRVLGATKARMTAHSRSSLKTKTVKMGEDGREVDVGIRVRPDLNWFLG